MAQPEPKGVVIVCPHCGTRYELSAETIGSGRLVQCAACMQSWQATVPGAVSFSPPPHDDDQLFDADAEAELDANFEVEERRTTQIAPVRDEPPPKAPPAPASAAPRGAPADPARRQQQKEYTERRKSMRRTLPVHKFRRIARLAVILILALIVGGGIVMRTEIVRQVPDLAGFYQVLGLGVNVIGLEFRNVKTQRALRDGVEQLSVEARIVGVSPRRVVVPPVVVTLLDPEGNSVYEWSVTPSARDLEAGEAVDFATTLTGPPDGADTVRLTFTNGRARTEMPIALSAEPLETHE
jgi:predicted Zn finger-like uncharacterized protein